MTDKHQTVPQLLQALDVERDQRILVEAQYQAMSALYSTLQYDEILDRLLEQVANLVPHDAVCLSLTQGDIARIFRWNGYNRLAEAGLHSPLSLKVKDVTSLRTMWSTGVYYLVEEADETDDWVSQSGQTWIRSYLGAPIQIYEQIIGFINLDSGQPNFFNKQHARELETFIAEAAGAIRNAWLYNRARREVLSRIRELKKERNFISAILDTSSALVYVLDANKKLALINKAIEDLFGYSLDEVKGKSIWNVYLPGLEISPITQIFDELSAEDHLYTYENKWITKDGEARYISWTSTVLLDQDGAVEYIITTGFDITDRKKVEFALRQSEERYALAALAANDGLWDWDLETNEIYYSDRWKSMLGYRHTEVGSSPEEWFERVHPDDLPRLKEAIQFHLDGSASNLESEYRIRHRDEKYRWVLTQWLVIRDESLKPRRLTGFQTDITQRKNAENQLWHASLHDGLTGLPNRTLFMERMEALIERSKEDLDYMFAVLFLDLDRFKVINDSMGHLVGDQLLIAIAERLKECIRPKDTVARFGGDEFAVLLDDISDLEGVEAVAERIQNKLNEPAQLAGQEVFPSASIGIAVSNNSYDFPEDMLRDADTTMYQAKANGRGRHAMFETGMHMQALEVWELEGELRRAIDAQELTIYYQPIVSIETGQITGVEALLRWQHPERGLIMPEKFLPLAEETGLIVPIGAWILQAACAQTEQWHRMGFSLLRVGVNISPVQIQQAAGQPDLFDTIAEVLNRTGLDPRFLQLEINETFPTTLEEDSTQLLDKIKALGVQFALDDFGISSSFLLLKQLPIDILKIDRAFVQDIASGSGDTAIISAIISMAQGMQLGVVAEGVESVEHLNWLRDRGCSEMQGYLFSKSKPAAEITTMLQSGLTLMDQMTIVPEALPV